jgi:predicted Na+-dependent transporter
MIADQAQMKPSRAGCAANRWQPLFLHSVCEQCYKLTAYFIILITVANFEWNMEQIQAQTNVSVNILDVVTAKIKVLPKDVRQILQ